MMKLDPLGRKQFMMGDGMRDGYFRGNSASAGVHCTSQLPTLSKKLVHLDMNRRLFSNLSCLRHENPLVSSPNLVGILQLNL